MSGCHAQAPPAARIKDWVRHPGQCGLQSARRIPSACAVQCCCCTLPAPSLRLRLCLRINRSFEKGLWRVLTIRLQQLESGWLEAKGCRRQWAQGRAPRAAGWEGSEGVGHGQGLAFAGCSARALSSVGRSISFRSGCSGCPCPCSRKLARFADVGGLPHRASQHSVRWHGCRLAAGRLHRTKTANEASNSGCTHPQPAAATPGSVQLVAEQRAPAPPYSATERARASSRMQSAERRTQNAGTQNTQDSHITLAPPWRSLLAFCAASAWRPGCRMPCPWAHGRWKPRTDAEKLRSDMHRLLSPSCPPILILLPAWAPGLSTLSTPPPHPSPASLSPRLQDSGAPGAQCLRPPPWDSLGLEISPFRASSPTP